MKSTRFSSALIYALLSGLSTPGSGLSQTQTVPTAYSSGPSKFENGFQIYWESTPSPGDFNLDLTDPEAKIEILETATKRLVTVHTVAAIRTLDPAITGVSVYDVSARKPGFIAVAAVYTRRQNTPCALLLYFDWKGELLRHVRFPDPTELDLVQVDESGNVWALNDFDRGNSAKFVFTKFNSQGSVVQQWVKPKRSWSTGEGSFTGGRVSFGLSGETLWTWLPKSRTLIKADALSGQHTVEHTGFPPIPGKPVFEARKAVLLPNGMLLIDVSWRDQGKIDSAWFTWSTRTGWNRMAAFVEGPNPYLYNLDGDHLIFALRAAPSEHSFSFGSAALSSLRLSQ